MNVILFMQMHSDLTGQLDNLKSQFDGILNFVHQELIYLKEKILLELSDFKSIEAEVIFLEINWESEIQNSLKRIYADFFQVVNTRYSEIIEKINSAPISKLLGASNLEWYWMNRVEAGYEKLIAAIDISIGGVSDWDKYFNHVESCFYMNFLVKVEIFFNEKITNELAEIELRTKEYLKELEELELAFNDILETLNVCFSKGVEVDYRSNDVVSIVSNIDYQLKLAIGKLVDNGVLQESGIKKIDIMNKLKKLVLVCQCSETKKTYEAILAKFEELKHVRNLLTA